MGQCMSNENFVASIKDHNDANQQAGTTSEESVGLKKRSTNQNHIIEKAKQTIDAANDKIKGLNVKYNAEKSKNEALLTQVDALRGSSSGQDNANAQYKEQLDVQRKTMIKWKTKIQELSEEIVAIEQERKETDDVYKNNLISINDSFYKIQGDAVGKLKYGKMSKKFVIFTEKINHLFYYDESGPKFIIVQSVTKSHAEIGKQMNLPWFMVVGRKRSALFAAESTAKRDKWCEFISQSLGDANAGDNGAVNPLFSADNALAKEMDDKLEDANHANCGHSHDASFGQQQSPINFVTDHHMQCKHTVLMGDEEYKTNTLSFQYPQFVKNCTIMNNGHTVQVNIAPSNKCVVSIAGKEFKLVQFHFHTPSEHTVDAKLFDMEMHLVHVNEQSEIAVLGFMFSTKQKYQRPKLELTKSRAHLVLASGQQMIASGGAKLKIMKESDDESDDEETDDEWDADEATQSDVNKLGKSKKGNDFLDQFFSQLPSAKTEQDILLKKPISFDYLFETSSNNFVKDVKSGSIDIDMELYTYKGSLTTPPYTEGVNWMVSKTTHFMNEKQLKDLSGCWMGDNNRDVQDYCGRQVKLRNKSSLQVV